MENDLAKFIVKFPTLSVGVVGDIALDNYLYGKVERINPERPGYPLIKIEKKEYRLGMASNVAINCVSLGAKTSLFGIIGKDEYGNELVKLAKKRKVSFNPIEDQAPTMVKQRFIESTHSDYLMRADFGEGKLEPLTAEQENKIFSSITALKMNVLILSDYNKRIFRGKLGSRLIAWANSKKITTIVDVKPVNSKHFHGATAFCPNLKEAREITGLNEGSKEEVAKKLKEITGCKYAVITCGPDGIIVYDGSFHHVPTRVKEVVDVSGAGDSVAAALGCAIGAGASILDACKIANYAAGIVVEKQGTASAGNAELIARINRDKK